MVVPAIELAGVTLYCETKSDLFSPKGLDQGTTLLLKQIAKQDYDTALDWGCGWGAAGLFMAALKPQAKVTALDANIGAVKMTSQNAAANKLKNIEVMASDSFTDLPAEAHFDLIAANPPTHQGRAVVDDFITESFDRLNPGGNLLIVVEARLKPWVARTMQNVFDNHTIATRGPKNVVLIAHKPENQL